MCIYHIPVLLRESIAALAIKPSGIYVDATFGGGGHSREILNQLGNGGVLLGFDQDPDTRENIPDDKRFQWIQSNFRYVHNFCRYKGYPLADGILADLGVSWHQFDTGERGFSFRFDSPLDMRMNRNSSLTAAQVLNRYTPEKLEELFFQYAELPNARALARAVVAERELGELRTTADLHRALGNFIPKAGNHKFLAKIYQALRIEVNGEMQALEGFLSQTVPLLKPGGRLVVITYHSLEDRMVKHFIRQAGSNKLLEPITKKPVLPSEEEIQANPRARSAKMRAAERTEERGNG
ncbi:MAG: 16S rRNA (cytosine(1402)-N(4))-methyltransferase RsmH [Bacteroidales bacterium]